MAPSVHQYDMLLGIRMPPPALERGLLHSRELVLPWQINRIVEKLGDSLWFSHYDRDWRENSPDVFAVKPYAVAGFWPSGGFVEVHMRRANPLEEHPRGTLTVFAGTAAQAEAMMAEFTAHYRFDSTSVAAEPRVGLLNQSESEITVERVALTAGQIVPRDQVDLYYGAGATAWADRWIEQLNARRYGLTVLTGPPGTGKTTLLRSLAQWLAESHRFYFMPAARFAAIESGALVTFWAGENRHSRLRKLLILEDAESLLLPRGRDNRDGVATLLNLTDGMMGDALGLHLVCTLNSDLGELDPALLRPGRLVAQREFGLLNREQAARLAAALNLPAPTGEHCSLAEIFYPPDASAERPPTPHRRTGFYVATQT